MNRMNHCLVFSISKEKKMLINENKKPQRKRIFHLLITHLLVLQFYIRTILGWWAWLVVFYWFPSKALSLPLLNIRFQSFYFFSLPSLFFCTFHISVTCLHSFASMHLFFFCPSSTVRYFSSIWLHHPFYSFSSN